MVESSLTDAMLQDDLEEEREAFVSYMRDNSQRDHVGCQEPFWITLEVALKTLIVDDVTIQVALVVILEMQVACAIQVRKLTWKRHLWKIPVTWKWNVRCMLSQRLSQRNVWDIGISAWMKHPIRGNPSSWRYGYWWWRWSTKFYGGKQSWFRHPPRFLAISSILSPHLWTTSTRSNRPEWFECPWGIGTQLWVAALCMTDQLCDCRALYAVALSHGVWHHFGMVWRYELHWMCNKAFVGFALGFAAMYFPCGCISVRVCNGFLQWHITMDGIYRGVFSYLQIYLHIYCGWVRWVFSSEVHVQSLDIYKPFCIWAFVEVHSSFEL